MRLADGTLHAIKETMAWGYIEACDFPQPATILAIATEVLESRAALAAKDAEIARLTKERDEARVNSDKWLKLTKAAERMFQQDADSHADFCARVAAGRDKP